MSGFEDKRSPLQKFLGERVSCKPIEILKGRLAGLPAALRALTTVEIQRATVEAKKYLTAEGWEADDLYTELGESIFNMETEVRLLAVALIAPPASGEMKTSEVQPLTSGPDQVRALFEPDEITLLMREFYAYQTERSPLSRATSVEEVEDLIEALGKGQAPISRLNAFDPSSLKSIITGLAVRQMNAMRRRSSPTSPSDAPETASSTPSGSETASPEGTSTSISLTVE